MRTDKHIIKAADLEKEIETALAHYPELKDRKIIFRFRVIERKSFMLAQPRLRTLILPRRWRQYEVIISKNYFTKNKLFEDGRVPSDVVVGWIGHELGHVADYLPRSSVNLMWFGFMYSFYNSFIKKAEISADKNAVKAGLIDYLVVSKEFGRNPKYFPQDYIDKLNSLYPSIADVKEWDRLHKLHQAEAVNEMKADAMNE
ncbi:hypothetical protein K6119_04590 [Paracrocinitomix mangrovi]|uniref:hypothetical protein n=1 Tax=Paracrocinitomix mangrovi TaxID=2862509 RepID=UPI001C8DB0AA|nr:hypothetical protein [Paracrocinitomix mangrovi]UKN02793.1 hypothetical protein K6119_04590 [Paracrocinitomix mangrovi]